MKKKLFILCAALVWTVALMAQEISVVDVNGNTQLFTTLTEAIEGADGGSVIYLPGGRFPIADSVKINKKLTIIGIGHYLSNEGNEDGATRIEGNLWYNEGSGGSAVMACYITGNVNIGDGGATVNDIVVRYCNLNSVQVKNNSCLGIIINQNYVRDRSYFGLAPVTITNNIIHSIGHVEGGTISYNFFVSYYDMYRGGSLYNIISSVVNSNCTNMGGFETFVNTSTFGNLGLTDHVGDHCIYLGNNINWNDVYVNYNNSLISPASDFHFKEEYKQYENQVGIYAGSGFNDKQQAPVPYIVAKQVDSETDAEGKLNIKIRVKASE